MSERVSDERLKELASIQARAAATYALEFDEDVLAVIEELIERRASDRHDYESELRRLSEFVQTRHPAGATKHIGLMEAVPSAMELISEASEWIGRHVKPDDAEPITAEWWLDTLGFPLIAKAVGPYCLYFESDSNVLLAQIGDADNATTCKLPHIRTRGDLRRLWLALTGRELDERKAGE